LWFHIMLMFNTLGQGMNFQWSFIQDGS
jgi:hypothetical protein